MPFSNAVEIPMLKDPLLLAVPSSNLLFGQESVRLEDLNGQYLLLSGMQMHFGQFIMDLLERRGIHPSRIEGCMAETLEELLPLKKAVCPVVDGIRRRIPPTPDLRFLPIVPECCRLPCGGGISALYRGLLCRASQFHRPALMDYRSLLEAS